MSLKHKLIFAVSIFAIIIPVYLIVKVCFVSLHNNEQTHEAFLEIYRTSLKNEELYKLYSEDKLYLLQFGEIFLAESLNGDSEIACIVFDNRHNYDCTLEIDYAINIDETFGRSSILGTDKYFSIPAGNFLVFPTDSISSMFSFQLLRIYFDDIEECNTDFFERLLHKEWEE